MHMLRTTSQRGVNEAVRQVVKQRNGPLEATANLFRYFCAYRARIRNFEGK